MSDARTIERENTFEFTSPSTSSPWPASEISVCDTFIDFVEVQSVTIIITPERSIQINCAGRFSFSASIRIEVDPASDAIL